MRARLGNRILHAFAAVSLCPTGLTATEGDFMARFVGNWSGSGTVVRHEGSKPWNVRCRVTGKEATNRVTVSGTCRAAVIASRQIGIDLKLDPASGRYSGTYTGSVIGPARLSGKRSGDSVVLTITWPKPVNGDTKATMTVVNSGNGSLRITVADNLKPGGPVQVTSDIRLSKG